MAKKVSLKCLINKYIKILGLSSWSISFQIIENKVAIAHGKHLRFKDNNFWAETQEIDLNKKQFQINIIKQALNSKYLEKIIFHELLHVLFWKLIDSKDIDKDKEEHFIIEKLSSMYFRREKNI
ncbi:MAG: hypothetical protein WC860_07065 [Candidatus Margulisiibacteriota bacterium]|jgi:predicted SprT family Zn-dependent metalloprotease